MIQALNASSFSVLLFIRLRENFPQRLAAVDNLRTTAFRALVFAHVSACEGGLLDLVHLNVAIGASGIAHKIVSLLQNPIAAPNWIPSSESAAGPPPSAV